MTHISSLSFLSSIFSIPDELLAHNCEAVRRVYLFYRLQFFLNREYHIRRKRSEVLTTQIDESLYEDVSKFAEQSYDANEWSAKRESPTVQDLERFCASLLDSLRHEQHHSDDHSHNSIKNKHSVESSPECSKKSEVHDVVEDTPSIASSSAIASTTTGTTASTTESALTRRHQEGIIEQQEPQTEHTNIETIPKRSSPKRKRTRVSLRDFKTHLGSKDPLHTLSRVNEPPSFSPQNGTHTQESTDNSFDSNSGQTEMTVEVSPPNGSRVNHKNSNAIPAEVEIFQSKAHESITPDTTPIQAPTTTAQIPEAKNGSSGNEEERMGTRIDSQQVKMDYFQQLEKRETEWTPEMRQQFLQLFQKYGRQFRLIAQDMSLPTSQVVAFYYDFKYLPEFREAIVNLKKQQSRQCSSSAYMRTRNKRTSRTSAAAGADSPGFTTRIRKRRTRKSLQWDDDALPDDESGLEPKRKRRTNTRSSKSSNLVNDSGEMIDTVVDRIIAMKETANPSGLNSQFESHVTGQYPFSDNIRYLVKWRDRSYWETEWVPLEVLLSQHMGSKKVQRFFDEYDLDSFTEMHALNQYFPDDYKSIERIVSADEENDTCLVKWKALEYAECTNENITQLRVRCPEFEQRFNEYKAREGNIPEHKRHYLRSQSSTIFQENPSQVKMVAYAPLLKTHDDGALFEAPHTNVIMELKSQDQQIVYDYELEMLNWLVRARQEKGLGVLMTSLVDASRDSFHRAFTVIGFIKYLRDVESLNGPHLVVCSLAQVENWLEVLRKELPDNNIVGLHGLSKSRELAIQYEFWYSNKSEAGVPKFDILVTTFEVCLAHRDLLQQINFQVAVVDGAHRIRRKKSKLRKCITDMKPGFKLLLMEKNTEADPREIFSILNFIDPKSFTNEDVFLEEHPCKKMQELQQFEDLQLHLCTLRDEDFNLVDDSHVLDNVLEWELNNTFVPSKCGDDKELLEAFSDQFNGTLKSLTVDTTSVPLTADDTASDQSSTITTRATSGKTELSHGGTDQHQQDGTSHIAPRSKMDFTHNPNDTNTKCQPTDRSNKQTTHTQTKNRESAKKKQQKRKRSAQKSQAKNQEQQPPKKKRKTVTKKAEFVYHEHIPEDFEKPLNGRQPRAKITTLSRSKKEAKDRAVAHAKKDGRLSAHGLGLPPMFVPDAARAVKKEAQVTQYYSPSSAGSGSTSMYTSPLPAAQTTPLSQHRSHHQNSFMPPSMPLGDYHHQHQQYYPYYAGHSMPPYPVYHHGGVHHAHPTSAFSASTPSQAPTTAGVSSVLPTVRDLLTKKPDSDVSD
mmetsp:Transcript_11244/g.42099  ORF Transcript_11244/g.42099 Transcript_11244/m.42099 type:complete len:1296 (-) Transcript_11244:615-4502(-)